ncbi:MAG: DUF2288 family protein [Myxococcota bacterium]
MSATPEVMAASWPMLREHAERNALFLVAPSLSLTSAAKAVASDDTAAVQRWIESGSLRRPTQTETSDWNERSAAFRAVIVQPFVLASIVDVTAAN